MEQYNPYPLSPTEEDISEINPYKEPVAQPMPQIQQMPQPQVQPVMQPVMQQPVQQTVQPVIQQIPQQVVYQQPTAVYQQPYVVTPVVQTPYYTNTQAPPYAAPYNALPNVQNDQAAQSAKKKGIASFILGLSALFVLTFGIFFASLLAEGYYDGESVLMLIYFVCLPAMGIVGIILGARSRKALRTGNGFAKAGLILSIIATAIVVFYIMMLLLIAIFSSLMWSTVDYGYLD